MSVSIDVAANASFSTVAEVGGASGDRVWPALVDLYRDQGFEAGYTRGVNDTLAAMLEAADEFVRLRADSPSETRRLLFAFSEFLEDRIRREPANQDQGFSDGLGI